MLVKTLPALIFAAVLWRKGARGLPFYGMLCCAAGDALLAEQAEGSRFLLGMGAFFVGYAAYSLHLRQRFATHESRTRPWIALLLSGALAAGILYFSWSRLSLALAIALPLYMLNLVGLAWHAARGPDRRLYLAVAALIASDALIAIERFIAPVPAYEWTMLSLYYAGQLLWVFASLK